MTTITLPRATVEQALADLKDLHKNHNITYAGTIAALEAALAQQAEPVEPHRWEGDHNIESPFNACMHKSYCMTLKQAEQAEPVTIERLRDALVASRIIPPAAVEDPDEYDDGVTLYRIEALHRRIT